MLLIKAVNLSRTGEVCNYEVEVFVNVRQIWKGEVQDHSRSDGWPVLAGHIARAAGIQSPEERQAIETALRNIKPEDGLIHCPACHKILGYA